MTQKPQVITINKEEEKHNVEINRGDIRNLFYLFTGRPDTLTKLLTKPVTIQTSNIIQLIKLLEDKLRIHNVDKSTSSITLATSDRKIRQYSTIEEFAKQNLEHEKAHSKYLTLKVDFLVNMVEYELPQRHVLKVRIGSEMEPSDVLQFVLGAKDNEEPLEIGMTRAICRVDYLNHILAEELIHIVEKWYESHEQKDSYSPLLSGESKTLSRISRFIRWSIPTMATFLIITSIMYLKKININTDLHSIIHIYFIWQISSIIALYMANKIGIKISQQIVYNTHRYNPNIPIEITSGDREKQKNIDKKTKSIKQSIAFQTLIAFLINIASGILTYYLLK